METLQPQPPPEMTMQEEENTLESQMKSYLPDEQISTLFLNFPSDQMRSDAVEKTKVWLKQLLQAEQAREAVSRHHDDDDNVDDDDNSDDSGMEYFRRGNATTTVVATTEPTSLPGEAFINALQDCPMILGFHAVMTHPTADRCCYCPCSKKLQPWRDHHGLQSIPLCRTTGKTSSNHPSIPNGFVAHCNDLMKASVNDNGTSLYHEIALKYCQMLYENYWGTGIHHKGLYIQGDDKYKKALAKEKKNEVMIMNRLRDDLVRSEQQKLEAEKRADRWEKTKTENPDLLNMKKKYDQKMDLLVRLGLAERTESGVEVIEKKKDALTAAEIKQFETHRAEYVELWKFRLNKARSTSEQVPIRIVFHSEEENPVAEWFNTASNAHVDDTFLFRELPPEGGSCAANFFIKWKLAFVSTNVPTKKQKIRAGKVYNLKQEVFDKDWDVNDGGTGDEGGPTKSFLMLLWSQLHKLTIPAKSPGSDRVPLFEDCGEYLLPTRNVTAQEQAHRHYRAVGRIMAYCLIRKQTIANHVLPDIYKNYLLRSISPLRCDYKLSDLINDLYDLLKQTKVSPDHNDNIDNVFKVFDITDDDDARGLELVNDEDDQPLISSFSSRERTFREFIYMEFIYDRRAALLAMKNGIRLNGAIPCERCLSVIPLEAVKKVLFDDGGYDLDFVLSRMKPVSVFRKENTDNAILVEIQENVFRVSADTNERQGILVDLLRDKCNNDAEFLPEFVWYVTASTYIRQSDFFINVEFNHQEMTCEESFPAVHSCENTIKFPALVYDGNKEILEEKLDYAMKNARLCNFDMA